MVSEGVEISEWCQRGQRSVSGSRTKLVIRRQESVGEWVENGDRRTDSGQTGIIQWSQNRWRDHCVVSRETELI